MHLKLLLHMRKQRTFRKRIAMWIGTAISVYLNRYIMKIQPVTSYLQDTTPGLNISALLKSKRMRYAVNFCPNS